MFEVIGIVIVWLFGLGVVFIVPILASDHFPGNGDGLANLVLGLVIGKILAGFYIMVTFAYLAIT